MIVLLALSLMLLRLTLNPKPFFVVLRALRATYLLVLVGPVASCVRVQDIF